ncbi:DUF3352 domain-containing protein [Aliterella atlantica]|uniref:DUF3352 domain-containing protein n=1 Tax=Aliterella atlantica CENA595 TaxID=1618023 RepID=A0A0D8ZYK4_9CYAN|nr:DUF3352 domain-containing protein [Aliterella atlantica]KJH73487.1 hypothetical protein UH38_01580 [Aliterella atlantica CENA595]
MIKKSKSSLLLTIGAASLLVGGGIAAYWLLIQPQKLAENLPPGINIVPQNALLVVSVSTEQAKWQQLRSFGTPQTQAAVDKYLVEMRDRFLTANGYNYQQDIQPWVGEEITLAIVPPQANPSTPTGTQQSIVAVLPIAKPDVAQQILAQPKSGKSRNYKGEEVKETKGYSATVLDRRFLVVSDNPQATERAIDTFKNRNSLTKLAGYSESLSKISDTDRFAQIYVNVPAAATVVNNNPRRSLSPQALAKLQQNQGLAATVDLKPEGIEFKSISWLKPNSDRTHVVQNNAGKMQSRLPAETLMMLSGGNLQQLWQDYVKGVNANPIAPFPPENLRSGVKSLTGLDLDEDLLSWMNGEFSLAVIPATAKTDSTPNDFALSLAFLVQASDAGKAKEAIGKLDRAISDRYQFKIQQAQVAGKPVTNWVAPYGTVTATHGWLDDNVAFFALGAPVAEKILPQSPANLASTEEFQKTVPSELKANNGQFFLNINPTFKALPLPQFIPNQQDFLAAVRSIGVTTAVSDPRSIRYDVFMMLNKAGNPQPLPSPSVPATPSP